MSQVKFDQREDIRVTTNTGGNGGSPPPRGAPQRGGFQGPPQKETISQEIGEALTKGAGPGGYLAVSTKFTKLPRKTQQP